MSRGDRRTVVLALDGLSLRYLDAFDLPALDRLRSRGVTAPLSSTHPPWTASAWPSMYTGVGPGHHGVYSFFDFEGCYPDDADLVTRNDVRAPALWNYLAADGAPVVVLNMPVTHPAEPVEGVLVPGYLAPETADGYPPGVREELSAALGEPYRIYAETELADDPDEKLDGYVDLVDRRRRAAVHLLEERAWQLAIVQVQKTDAVFHNFADRGAFERVYRAADDLVGDVLAAAGQEANVVVCSDHGIGPNTGYVIHVNQLLDDHGLVASVDANTVPTLRQYKRRWLDEASGAAGGAPEPAASTDGPEAGAGASGQRPAEPGGPGATRRSAGRTLRSRAVDAAIRGFRAVGLPPGRVYGVAQRLGLGPSVRRLLPAGASVTRGVDWRASDAYCRVGSELGVRINLEGREPAGTVAPADYRAVRGTVLDLLRSLRTPDGDPAFEFVAAREQVYDGPHADAAPDVVFRPAGMNHGVSAGLVGTTFVPIDEHNHEVEGTFIAAGPDVDADAGVGSLSLTDVAPIVMALLGRPVPERMTGEVPSGVVRGPVGRAAYPDVRYGTADEAGDAGRVEERLEDLGYL